MTRRCQTRQIHETTLGTISGMTTHTFDAVEGDDDRHIQ